MQQHVETFHGNEVYKLAIIFWYQLLSFQNRNFVNTFQTLFVVKKCLPFNMKINHVNIVFHWTSFTDGPVSHGVGLFSGLNPGSGSAF